MDMTPTNRMLESMLARFSCSVRKMLSRAEQNQATVAE